MNEKTMELLRLVEQNPGLPIVSMVDAEIVSDDYGYYLASISYATVDEYLVTKRDNRVCFKSDDDVFDVLENQLSGKEFDSLPDDESECRTVYNTLPWKKAIILYFHPYEPENG